MDRFIVVSIDEAVERGYPTGGEEVAYLKWGDLFWCLFETDGEKPIRLVGTDAMEPEDAVLVRDLGWVVQELNQLAQEVKE